MTIDRKLLEILVCPITKLPVSVLSESRLQKLNSLIKEGVIHYHNGEKVEKQLQQVLITDNGSTLYPVEENIPIMLEDQSISCHQIGDW